MAKLDAHLLSTQKKKEIADLCFSLLEIVYDDMIKTQLLPPDMEPAARADRKKLNIAKANFGYFSSRLEYLESLNN